MFNEIYHDEKLYPIISNYCSENNIEICLSEELQNHADDKLIILKVDEYYSSDNMHNPPPALDCVILVKCDKKPCYDLYLIELKAINSPDGFNKANILQKFKTVIDDFLESQFSHIFSNQEYCNFNCYFVSNPYRCNNISQDEYEKKIRIDGLKLDYFNSIKPFRFKNKVSFIQSKLPNPLISEC